MFSKAFAVITNVIGQRAGKDLPYEASDENYSCLSGKTIWEVKKAKRKVFILRVNHPVMYEWGSRNCLCVRLYGQIRG